MLCGHELHRQQLLVGIGAPLRALVSVLQWGTGLSALLAYHFSLPCAPDFIRTVFQSGNEQMGSQE